MPEDKTENTQPIQVEDPNMLVGIIAKKVRATLGDVEGAPDAASVLMWIVAQKPEVVKRAIIGTQPKAWAVGAGPLTESLTPEQCAGMLAALMAVFVQTL